MRVEIEKLEGLVSRGNMIPGVMNTDEPGHPYVMIFSSEDVDTVPFRAYGYTFEQATANAEIMTHRWNEWEQMMTTLRTTRDVCEHILDGSVDYSDVDVFVDMFDRLNMTLEAAEETEELTTCG